MGQIKDFLNGHMVCLKQLLVILKIDIIKVEAGDGATAIPYGSGALSKWYGSGTLPLLQNIFYVDELFFTIQYDLFVVVT